MRNRRIVFFGNCQAEGLASVYDQQFGRISGDKITYMSSYEENVAARIALEEADVVIAQQFDFPSKVAAEVKLGTQCILFPSVVAGFLWPFGSRAHPLNAPTDFCKTGPYPAQMGDAFLNKLIMKNVPVDEAIAQYLELDVVKTASLDRLYELGLQRQQRRDELTSIDTASVIEKFFRSEHIFFTPDHPNSRVFLTVAREVYAKLGVSGTAVEASFGHLRHTPFPLDANPLHPAVIKHFGIKFAGSDYRYRYFFEGGYTFEEFIRRYYTYKWNSDLHEGVYLSGRGGDPAHALDVLNRGLAASPRSLQGLCNKAALLARLSRYGEADAVARSAVEFWPGEPESHISLGNLRRTMGDLPGAEYSARQAVDCCNVFAPAYLCLSQALEAEGKLDDAVAAIEAASELQPGEAAWQTRRAEILARSGQYSAATAAFRKALAFTPPTAELHAALANSLAAEGRHEEAAAELLLAKAALGERTGKDPSLLHTLGLAAMRSGSHDEALKFFKELAEISPKDPHAHAAVGSALTRRANYMEAEASYRIAATLAPQNADICRALADVIGLQGRDSQALSLALQALQMAPTQAVNYGYLGHQLIRNKFGVAAEPILQRALELDPMLASAARSLAELLCNQRRYEDAADVWRNYLAKKPDDVDAIRQLELCSGRFMPASLSR